MEQRILLPFCSVLQLSPIWMLPCLLNYDICLIIFLQPDGKTILLGTEFGKVKEYNLMTGQVRENLSPWCHRHHHDCIGNFVITIVILLIIV